MVYCRDCVGGIVKSLDKRLKQPLSGTIMGGGDGRNWGPDARYSGRLCVFMDE